MTVRTAQKQIVWRVKEFFLVFEEFGLVRTVDVVVDIFVILGYTNTIDLSSLTTLLAIMQV